MAGEAFADLLAPGEHALLAGVSRVERDRPEDRGPDVVERVLQRGGDTEAPATAAQSPEQVWVSLEVGVYEAPVRGDHVGADQVVAREPVITREETHAAVQRQPGDSRLRDNSKRRRESKRLGLVVDVAEPRAAGGADGLPLGIYEDVSHAGQ